MHWLSPAQELCVVYVKEQCCTHCPCEFMKQFEIFSQVVGSVMLLHCCVHVAVFGFHVHVVSPAHCCLVDRMPQTMAQAPVEVTLQSGRDSHALPLNAHCVIHAAAAVLHSQTGDPRHATRDVEALQLVLQIALMESQKHAPSDVSQPALLL
jgi:hypothetical protein